MSAAFSIDCRAAMRQLSRDLNDLGRRQVPYATALTLNEVAREVVAAETAQLERTFDKPTPFTRRAFGYRAARKTNLTATVFAKDRQAGYLAPYAFGGLQALGSKRAMLTPVEVALNQYGNIPRGKIAALKGKPGYFVGDVKTGSGRIIGGLWKRPLARQGKGPGKLQLLVEFTRPKPVTKHLPYEAVARATVARTLGPAWSKAMDRALATAR